MSMVLFLAIESLRFAGLVLMTLFAAFLVSGIELAYDAAHMEEPDWEPISTKRLWWDDELW